MEFINLQHTEQKDDANETLNQAILAARAKKLAQFDESPKKTAGVIEVLTFHLANELYGIEAKYIKEVYPIKEISTLPSVPKYIYGLINIRRRVYSIVDLRPLFDLPVMDRTLESRVIILKNDQMSFGLFADQVIVLRSIGIDELQLHIEGLNGIRKDILKGVTKDRLIVLDGDKLLNDERLY